MDEVLYTEVNLDLIAILAFEDWLENQRAVNPLAASTAHTAVILSGAAPSEGKGKERDILIINLLRHHIPLSVLHLHHPPLSLLLPPPIPQNFIPQLQRILDARDLPEQRVVRDA